MGLEKRVEVLDAHFESLDGAVHDLLEVTKNTHNLVKNFQLENRQRFDQIDKRFEQIDKRFEQKGKDMAEFKAEVRSEFADLKGPIAQALPSK